MHFNHFLAFFLVSRLSEALLGWESPYVHQYFDLLNQTMIMREFAPQFRHTTLLAGLKWCGPDEFIEDDQELGQFAAIDACCKTHQLCPNFIHGFHTKYNLVNPVNYKRWHCDCDKKLRHCLLNTTDDEAVTALVGNIYFEYLGTQCFKLEFPIAECSSEHYRAKVNHADGIWRKKCTEYVLKEEQDKIYQWFDVGNFPNSEELKRIRNNTTGLSESEEVEDLMEIP